MKTRFPAFLPFSADSNQAAYCFLHGAGRTRRPRRHCLPHSPHFPHFLHFFHSCCRSHFYYHSHFRRFRPQGRGPEEGRSHLQRGRERRVLFPISASSGCTVRFRTRQKVRQHTPQRVRFPFFAFERAQRTDRNRAVPPDNSAESNTFRAARWFRPATAARPARPDLPAMHLSAPNRVAERPQFVHFEAVDRLNSLHKSLQEQWTQCTFPAASFFEYLRYLEPSDSAAVSLERRRVPENRLLPDE